MGWETTYLLTGTFFELGRYQASTPMSQGLLPPLDTEEWQVSHLLLPKGQAVAGLHYDWECPARLKFDWREKA